MIPHYYDTERVARIMRDDDTMEYATINQPSIERVKGPDGQMQAARVVLNDMTAGEFDITVSAGPSYSTLRQEAAEGMAEIMARNPALWPIVGDLYVKNQDWPGADAMAARLKKTVPPQLVEDEDKDEPAEVIQTQKGPIPVAQVPQVLAQLEEQNAMLMEALEKAKAGDVANKSRELDIKDKEANTHAREADIAGTQAQRDAEDERLKNIAAAEKAYAESVKAEADLVRARNEAVEREETQAPTLEEIAALMEAHRPQIPESLSIKAPSGQVYVVDMKMRH